MPSAAAIALRPLLLSSLLSSPVIIVVIAAVTVAIIIVTIAVAVAIAAAADVSFAANLS
jgi:hypothetical protein